MSHSRTTEAVTVRARARRRVLASLAVVALLDAAVARAEDVAAAVLIEAPSFVVNLQAGKAVAERAASAALAATLARHFPVASWRAAGAPTRSSLTVALIEREARPLSVVTLVWRGAADGTPLDLPALAPETLYLSGQPNRANHDPDELAQLLAARLDAWFANENNRRLFQADFLRHVPIARRAAADPQRRRVVLPFSTAALKMDTNSQLRLQISFPGTPPRQGLIDVTGLLDDGARGTPSALGTVSKVNAADGTLASGWSTQVPALLAPSSQVTVFVERYIYSAAPTVNGTFQQP